MDPSDCVIFYIIKPRVFTQMFNRQRIAVVSSSSGHRFFLALVHAPLQRLIKVFKIVRLIMTFNPWARSHTLLRLFCAWVRD